MDRTEYGIVRRIKGTKYTAETLFDDLENAKQAYTDLEKDKGYDLVMLVERKVVETALLWKID